MGPESQLIFCTRKKVRVIFITMVTSSSISIALSICSNTCWLHSVSQQDQHLMTSTKSLFVSGAESAAGSPQTIPTLVTVLSSLWGVVLITLLSISTLRWITFLNWALTFSCLNVTHSGKPSLPRSVHTVFNYIILSTSKIKEESKERGGAAQQKRLEAPYLRKYNVLENTTQRSVVTHSCTYYHMSSVYTQTVPVAPKSCQHSLTWMNPRKVMQTVMEGKAVIFQHVTQNNTNNIQSVSILSSQPSELILPGFKDKSSKTRQNQANTHHIEKSNHILKTVN